jgi:hypothetical protein
LIWPECQFRQGFVATDLSQRGDGLWGEMIFCNMDNNAMAIGTESPALGAANCQPKNHSSTTVSC